MGGSRCVVRRGSSDKGSCHSIVVYFSDRVFGDKTEIALPLFAADQHLVVF
jgi:hypothetical protein